MDIVKLSIAVVGIVQIIKNVVPAKGNRLIWTGVTIVVGVGIAYLQHVQPIDAVIGISGATIFYDTIYKKFESLFLTGGSHE